MKFDLNRQLYFVSKSIKEKYIKQSKAGTCPFCDTSNFSEIIDEDDSILLVKNKFQTLKNTFQTVLIETDNCKENISTYDKNHLQKIITFGINQWFKMEKSEKFKSVVFYKNHGPLSGGSINHAHMQIVGLENIDYRENLSNEIFEGIEICRENDCLINLSTRPLSCGMEINIIVNKRNDDFMAENIQKVVRYVLKQTDSYNLFFYQWKKSIICKIAPRYVASPFLIGYSIPQTSNRLESIAESLKKNL